MVDKCVSIVIRCSLGMKDSDYFRFNSFFIIYFHLYFNLSFSNVNMYYQIAFE